MGLFVRFGSWSDQASTELPPTEILATLVDDLYAPVASFAIGAVTAALVGGIAAWRTGNSLLTILTICTVAVASARLFITLEYRKRKPAISGDLAAVGRWERWFATGAWAYAGCVGALCFIVFACADDALSALLLNANAVGYTAGVAARNSSRPRIALAQLSLILLPITIGSALRGGFAYAVLSMITFLYYLATIEITRYLSQNRSQLLLANREQRELAGTLAEQNFRFDAALSNMAQGLCMFDRQQRLLISNQRFAEIFRISPDSLAHGMSISEVMALTQTRDKNPELAVATQRELLAESQTVQS